MKMRWYWLILVNKSWTWFFGCIWNGMVDQKQHYDGYQCQSLTTLKHNRVLLSSPTITVKSHSICKLEYFSTKNWPPSLKNLFTVSFWNIYEKLLTFSVFGKTQNWKKNLKFTGCLSILSPFIWRQKLPQLKIISILIMKFWKFSGQDLFIQSHIDRVNIIVFTLPPQTVQHYKF